MFIHDRFLLQNNRAVRLYEDYARSLPIIDYHSHLPAADIAGDRKFANLTQIWLAGDHYKWRAMRACGDDERLCTGDGTDREKFQAWAETVPKTLRNPLYHWTHMELKAPFGITDVLLGPKTAQKIWDTCNKLLAQDDFSAQGILRQMNVHVVSTTEDPTDPLEPHRAYQEKKGKTFVMVTAFRPDKAMNIEGGADYSSYLERLGASAGTTISTYTDLLDALKKRHTFFHESGCRLSDHGLETIYAEEYTEAEIAGIFRRGISGSTLTAGEVLKFKSALLYEFAVLDHARGWTQQYHLGALRNVNPRMFRLLGPDTGYDTIGDFEMARPLARLLGRLDDAQALPKTILYNLNPRDNELLATMIGNYQDGSVAGKMQFGSAWWFLDQKDGMERHLNALSTLGLLSQFVGMLTDSRSFLSFPRHDYFRRVLCNMLGEEMERGLIPDDMGLVGPMVSDICYHNARNYFAFPQLEELIR